MGNSCSKRTVKEVTDDLETNLLASAKKLLKADFGQTLDDNHSGLQDAIEALAKAEFKQQFGYDWGPTSVSPPDMDSDNPQYHLASDYCIIPADQDITKAIAKYVDNGLGASGLHDWMKEKAVADLSSIIGKYINYPVDTEWHYGPGTAQYDAVDTKEDSYKLNLSLVYTNATKTESAVEVSLHILYFVGVYYTIKSPKAVTFAKLRKDAWDAARKLKNVTKSVTSDPQLKAALYEWSTASDGVFYDDFKRRWDAQPDDYATDETLPVSTRNDELAFFNTKDLTKDFLDKYIDANIMIGFNLPTKDMQAWLKAFLLKEYQTILSQTNTNGWNSMKVDQTYGLKSSIIRPVRANGEIIYWASEATIQDGNQSVTVIVYYIYFLGFIYELKPDSIYQDLSRKLVKNIPGVDEGSVPSHIGPDDVQAYVEKFNKSKFYDAYKIVFPDSNVQKDNLSKHWKGFFEFDHWYPNEADIKNEVAERIFRRDPKFDSQIHHDLQPAVYDWIVEILYSLSSKTTAKDPNEWYNLTKTNNFKYTGNDKKAWVLGVSTSWVYCNATITEDGSGGKTLSNFYLSVLIYATAALEAVADDEV